MRESNRNLYLSRLNRQWKALLCSNLQTELDSFPDVLQGLALCLSLADAAWYGGAFHHPYPVFVPVNCYVEFHSSLQDHRVRAIEPRVHGDIED